MGAVSVVGRDRTVDRLQHAAAGVVLSRILRGFVFLRWFLGRLVLAAIVVLAATIATIARLFGDLALVLFLAFAFFLPLTLFAFFLLAALLLFALLPFAFLTFTALALLTFTPFAFLPLLTGLRFALLGFLDALFQGGTLGFQAVGHRDIGITVGFQFGEDRLPLLAFSVDDFEELFLLLNQDGDTVTFALGRCPLLSLLFTEHRSEERRVGSGGCRRRASERARHA